MYSIGWLLDKWLPRRCLHVFVSVNRLSIPTHTCLRSAFVGVSLQRSAVRTRLLVPEMLDLEIVSNIRETGTRAVMNLTLELTWPLLNMMDSLKKASDAVKCLSWWESSTTITTTKVKNKFPSSMRRDKCSLSFSRLLTIHSGANVFNITIIQILSPTTEHNDVEQIYMYQELQTFWPSRKGVFIVKCWGRRENTGILECYMWTILQWTIKRERN